MKTKMLVSILILVFTGMIVVGSGATGKKAYVATKDEEFYGTWINKDHIVQKEIIYPDGKQEVFYSLSSVSPFATGQFTIMDKRTDSKGNIYYKCTWTSNVEGEVQYCLFKISNSGIILETIWSPVDYPKKIDPNDLDYLIRYRQE